MNESRAAGNSIVRVLTNQQIPGADYCTWDEFEKWLNTLGEYQLDIETNVTPFWCDKRIVTIQFGDIQNTVQYVLEWAILTENQKTFLKQSIEDWEICKLAHNAAFEYIVLRFHGIELHNLYCTMVAEKVLNGGIEMENYALSDLTEKYLGFPLDKSLQLSFGDGILTLEKVEYAATDCKYLGELRRRQLIAMSKWMNEQVKDPLETLRLEMKALHVFSDFTYYGMGIDTEKWMENEALASPIVEKAAEDLDQWVRQDSRLRDQAIKLGYYHLEDKLDVNFSSPQQKLQAFKLVFPDLEGASMGLIKGYIGKHGQDMEVEKLSILLDAQYKNYDTLVRYLRANHREELIEKHLLVPAGAISINWNSTTQVLKLVKIVEPRLKDLSSDSVAKTTHPIFTALEEYKDSLKLVSTYGRTFLEKWIEPDGMVRTNYNSVVSTGRSSSLKPNMQNIPAKEAPEHIVKDWLAKNPDKTASDFNNRYRNAFIWHAGFKFVDSDYRSQELAVIAQLAKDEAWFQAILNGDDLHSVTAAMVFGAKWSNAAQPDCKYTATRQKCKCPGHKTMRNAIKSINFGLAYGMSEFKLSGMLDISLKEAKALIDQYFNTFPRIKQVLNYLGRFGVERGYIQTLAPFYRRRTFPLWVYHKDSVRAHLNGDYNSTLGSIERQSKNMPIQGSSGDMMKLAMWYCYKWIRDNGYVDRINLVLNVHDQLTTVAEDDLCDMWAQKLDELMVEAAKVILPSGLLKAETTVSPYWTK